ncbi:DUF927 domain-containing protein [Ethanoligenens sp.]|uniref:DUF927 domain-containing protein n=1 Tax=Ethanoligenens sp. TaxID=2099655 RepID=UPI0039EA2665
MWSNPNLRAPNGLAHTWNSTLNAMLKELDGNHGLPVLFDEIGMSEANSFHGLLYMLGTGVEKARLNRMGGFRDKGIWTTTIIMTGEFSPLQQSEKYEGLQVRLLEFSDVSWTSSGNQADAIKNGILSNHGHAGPKFVEYILPRLPDVLNEIETKEQEVKTMLKAKGLTSNLVERRAWHLAVLMETVHCINESALKLDLDEEAILQFLLDQEVRANRESDLGETSYQYFKEQILSNWNHFLKKGMGDDQDRFHCPSEIWGRIDRIHDGSFEVNVFPENFERIMRRGSFTSIKSILIKWKNNGRLSFEEGRITRKRKLIPNGLQLPIYVAKFNDADEIIPPSVPTEEDAVTASDVGVRDNEKL